VRIYLKDNVLEAAKKRIAWVFDEFEHVIVNFSGGKDSCVVLNLALAEAERRGRLPLPVHWIDQEAEWGATVEYVEQVMNDPRVLPRWFQIPMRIFNATSPMEPWLHVWDPEAEARWMRPKWPRAITENVFGTERFGELFAQILAHYYPGQAVASLGGVRAEESPARAMGMTSFATYKWVTWGTIQDRKLRQFNFYPIYDWGYKDVWKAIHEHGWRYCAIYDRMYQYGYHIRDMRLSGINTIKHLKGFAMDPPRELPPMFATWVEYRDHLAKNLLADDETKAAFAKRFAHLDRKYGDIQHPEMRHRVEIASILANDYHFTKLKNWEFSPAVGTWRKWKRGLNIPRAHLLTNPYINA
jgi:predicted phosphoadenosine phosphosulfate sulfurtransferase